MTETENYYHSEFDNGLQLRAHKNSRNHRITMNLYFPVDPARLRLEDMGVYHLLEHLFFRRMHGFCQEELYYRMERIGTTLLGTTYHDYIQFSISVLVKYFDPAFEILHRLLLPISWTDAEIKGEKQVVANQILYQEYYDFLKMSDKIYYKGTGYEYPIMGKRSYVTALRRDRINFYKERIFVPDNVYFTIAGNFDDRHLERIVTKLGQLPPGRNMDDQSVKKPERFCARTDADCYLYFTEYDESDIAISFDLSPELDPYQAEYLSSIIGEGVGSCFSRRLREELGVTNEIYSETQWRRCGKRLLIRTTTADRSIVTCLEEIFSILDQIKAGIPEKEYLSSRVFKTENWAFLYDDTKALSDRLGQILIYQEPFETVANIMDYYKTDRHTTAAGVRKKIIYWTKFIRSNILSPGTNKKIHPGNRSQMEIYPFLKRGAPNEKIIPSSHIPAWINTAGITGLLKIFTSPRISWKSPLFRIIKMLVKLKMRNLSKSRRESCGKNGSLRLIRTRCRGLRFYTTNRHNAGSFAAHCRNRQSGASQTP